MNLKDADVRTRMKHMIVAAMILFFAAPLPLAAQQRGASFIRDAEIEDTIRVISTPLFQQAGLSPAAIDVYLINDDSLNAFVAGGLNMFLHTGFLVSTTDIGEVMGVIAHETGHIEGGHLAARKAEIEDLKDQLLATYVLGLGAAILSGNPGVGTAATLATQAAVRLLQGAGYSPSGLLDFMKVLHGQEALLSSSQDPYLRSHPLTQDRMTYLAESVQESPYRSKPFPPDLVERYQRMKAKLVGFLKPMHIVERQYPQSDASIAARYARAIAQYRNGSIDTALEQIEALIQSEPGNPYFWELKGQVLYENGRINESIPPYEEATRLAPESALLRIGLAAALLQLPGNDLVPSARDHLYEALKQEDDNPTVWRYLAIAEGRLGNTGLAALSLAEAAWARGNAKETRDQAERAQKLLDNGTRGKLRAEDLQRFAENELKKKKN